VPNTFSRRSQRYRPAIFVLLLSCFVLLMLQTASLSKNNAEFALHSRAEADLNRYLLSLQQKLDRYKDLPKLLSTHSELLNSIIYFPNKGALARANQYLEQVNDTIGASATYVMDIDGTTVAASNWQEELSFVGRNFDYRPYFQDAVMGRAGRYFALGTTSKKRGYFFSYPIHYRENIIGVVVVKIDLNDIERDWSDPLTDIVVTDEDGVIVISTQPDWKYRTIDPLSQDDLKRIVASQRYGEQQLLSLNVLENEARAEGGQLITLVEGSSRVNDALDGVQARQFLKLYKGLPDTGLNVMILANMRPVDRQVYSAVALVGVCYVLLVFISLFLLARQRIKNERASFRLREMQALEDNQARIRAIIDTTQAGLIAVDTTGRIESFNPTAEKLFGYNAAAMSGVDFTHLLSASDHLPCRHYLEQGDDDDSMMIEATGLRQGGERFPIELSIGRMVIAEERHFLVTIHDITERKQYEERLQRARELLEHRVEERTSDLTQANHKLVKEVEQHRNTQNELIQTAKLAVLGQMSAGINHELNQPLTAIRSYADNAKAFLEMGRTETVALNLQEISGLTERMAKIIHPLKEFARKTSGQKESVCLKAIRDGAMSIMYGRLDKASVEVNWPTQLEQIFVVGEIVRLEQVLVNLLGNALQAMESVEQKRIDIGVSSDQGWLALSVRDYGPGIEPHDLEQVFEPFFTTKKAGQGLGLGLSISHRIISSLGGRLEVANHPQGGAVFTLHLKLAGSQTDQPEKTEKA